MQWLILHKNLAKITTLTNLLRERGFKGESFV